MGRGTKVRREEFGLFSADELIELELLRRLKASGAKYHPAFPVAGHSTDTYNKSIRRALNAKGLGFLDITAHSARAGFATDEIVKGTKFEEVQAAGRWASAKSLRIYLDAVVSRAISSAPEVARFHASGIQLEEDLFLYFPLHF